MDIVLIVLVILIVIVGLFFKDFKSVVYFIAILEVLFRLLHKISSLLNVNVFNNFVNSYIPSSIEGIINIYSSGILNTILIWVMIFIFSCFLYYLVIYWIKKKK